MKAKGYFTIAVVVFAICFIIAIQNQWGRVETSYNDVGSIDVLLGSYDENEVQLEAHQCSIWKTNFQSRYENFDYTLNVIFRTKNGSTEQIGFTRSYENALNCIETNQQDKNIEDPYLPYSQDIEQEGTRNEVFYGNNRGCRWPDASGTYFIFLQAGEEGWRGSVAPYRTRAGSQGDTGYCVLAPFLFCYLGIVCLIPLLLILLLFWWLLRRCCKWRIPLIILLVVPMGILLSPCGVLAFRVNYYNMAH